MKRQADQLITAIDDLLVTEAAGHGQWQIILLRFFHEVENPIKQIADF